MLVYKDVNQYYNENNDKDKELYNIDTVYQDIYNLLTTPKMSRAFLPEYGTNFEGIFELMEDEAEEKILAEIDDAIETYIPRVDLIISSTEIDLDYDSHTINLNLYFKVLELSEEEYVFKLKFTA